MRWLPTTVLSLIASVALAAELRALAPLSGGRPGVEIRLSAPVTPKTLAPLDDDANASHRIVVDLPGTTLGPGARTPLPGSGPITRVRTGQFTPTTARVVLDVTEPTPFTIKTTPSGIQVLLLPRKTATAPAAVTPAPTPPAAIVLDEAEPATPSEKRPVLYLDDQASSSVPGYRSAVSALSLNKSLLGD